MDWLCSLAELRYEHWDLAFVCPKIFAWTPLTLELNKSVNRTPVEEVICSLYVAGHCHCGSGSIEVFLQIKLIVIMTNDLPL